jgi:DNA-binding response OmpR family regulator
MSKILLVEPDHMLAGTYQKSLQAAGHEVIICASAQAAISSADISTPDIVVLELQLIEHSGIEFLYEFRSYPEWQSIPVVVLSHVPPGEFSGSRNLLTHELGVRAYHYKPQTSLRRLLATVNEFATSTA